MLLSHVEPEYHDRCKTILEGGRFSFSQSWQDWLVFHRIFSHRTTWGGGTYIDFGTNDPVEISNTIFFDKCLGWRGLCIEMQDTYHSAIREKRSCTLVPHCVMGVAGRVSVDGGGGTATARLSEAGAIQCIGISELLQMHGFPARVDFMSIDIEASEPGVLRCWNFSQVSPKAILIETNKAEVSQVDLFFHRNGYSNVDTILANDAARSIARFGASPWLDNLYVRDHLPRIYPPGFVHWMGQGHPNPWTCEHQAF